MQQGKESLPTENVVGAYLYLICLAVGVIMGIFKLYSWFQTASQGSQFAIMYIMAGFGVCIIALFSSHFHRKWKKRKVREGK